MKTKALDPIRRVIGLPMHRAHRPVDSPSLAPYVATREGGYVDGRHRLGLAEVFRRRFTSAIAERRIEQRAEHLDRERDSST